jgi:DNA-binding Lrp family transcriptional regulator
MILDKKDRQILDALQQDARQSLAAWAGASACRSRPSASA